MCRNKLFYLVAGFFAHKEQDTELLCPKMLV